MKDQYEREIEYLRLSVTDLCNLRCRYCMSEDGVPLKLHEDMFTFEDMLQAIEILSKHGIHKVRITGGEPLVKKDILSLLKQISLIEGIDELCLTTNGILLKDYAYQLKKANVQRINISLDTLNPKKYHEMTRRGHLQDVLDGIQLALQLFQVKINVVYMKGFNDDEIDDFINFANKHQIEVRFIELMPIGEAIHYQDYFVSLQDEFSHHPLLYPLDEHDGVARLYQIKDGHGKIGIINAMSHSFCHLCNRIRITADGKLKPCLFSQDEYDLRHLNKEDMENVIKDAIFHKPRCKEEEIKTTRSMNQIGG